MSGVDEARVATDSAEVALVKLTRQLADLEQLMDVGFWDFDVANGTVEWSGGQCRLYGVDPDRFEATYDAWFAMVHPDDRAMIGATITDAIERVGDYGFDHRFHRATDGALRWTRCRGRVFPGPDGAAQRIFGVSIDTTDDHVAAEARAGFVANAAHELRTPAAAIYQAVQALARTDDPAGREEIQGVLGRQARRLNQLAVSLVDLAAVEATASASLLEAVEVAAVVESAVANALVPDDRSVAVDVPAGLLANADADQLDRVLVNLLVNAFRYGGPNVVIRARRHQAAVVLEVCDDGDGVAEEDRASIFEPFHRGPQRHPEASGLGLAIVDTTVRRLGGSVAYRDGAPGAVFAITLEGA